MHNYEIVELRQGDLNEFPLDITFKGQQKPLQAYTFGKFGWQEENGVFARLMEFSTLEEIELALNNFSTSNQIHSVIVTKRFNGNEYVYGSIIFVKYEGL